MLRRGFWLYVWRVETPKGEMLYVGRTGDSSSPNASAPYTRMGQHLGFRKNQNALRRHLVAAGISPEDCAAFDLIAHGPIHPEIEKPEDADHATLFKAHRPRRDAVAAMEKALADALQEAGYRVLNTVKCRHPLNTDDFAPVLEAFAEECPALRVRS